jgi:hypothetical protein
MMWGPSFRGGGNGEFGALVAIASISCYTDEARAQPAPRHARFPLCFKHRKQSGAPPYSKTDDPCAASGHTPPPDNSHGRDCSIALTICFSLDDPLPPMWLARTIRWAHPTYPRHLSCDASSAVARLPSNRNRHTSYGQFITHLESVFHHDVLVTLLGSDITEILDQPHDPSGNAGQRMNKT